MRRTRCAAAWRPLAVRPWQLRRRGDESQAPLAAADLFGDTVGPHPVLLLGPSDHPAFQRATSALIPTFEALGYRHGVIAPRPAETAWERRPFDAVPSSLGIPHPHGDARYSDGHIARYCSSVAALADTLNLSWMHVVSYSFGSLVAVKLALMYPRLVGTLTFIDTAVATEADLASHDQRNSIYAARLDINTPVAELDAAVANHQAFVAKASVMGAPAAEDQAVFDSIFGAHTYSADGSARNLGEFMTPDHLRMMRHPVMSVHPNKQNLPASSASALAMNRKLFNVQRVLHVKCASSHEDLFGSGDAVSELSNGLGQWLRRFDVDAQLARRVEQAHEVVKGGGAPPPKAAAAEDSSATKGKKKDKKKEGGKKPIPKREEA
jgi:pimeloyl-ACP methyl ester carboxylesterase